MNVADIGKMSAISFFGVALLLGFVVDDVTSVFLRSYKNGKKVVDTEFFPNFIIANADVHDDLSKDKCRLLEEAFPGRLHDPSHKISFDEFNKTLHQASLLGENLMFQDLNPYHRELARPLFEILMKIEKNCLNRAVQDARKQVNKYLLLFVSRLVVLHRNDTEDTFIPSHVTIAPHLYFDLGNLAMEKLPKKERKLYLSGGFHDDPESRDLEYRLSYFRLDPGMNSHHEHWHISHLDSPGYIGDWKVYRSGEMFYHMHSQMMRRYDFERLSVKAPLVLPLLNFRDPIPEPYFEKLQTEKREKLWDSRPPNKIMTDINVRGVAVNVEDLEVARHRIYDAIDRGQVYKRKIEDDVETVEPLNGPKNDCQPIEGAPCDLGIDKLGDMVWAYQKRSVNYRYYGNLHNLGHEVLGNMHDPQGMYHRQSRGMAMSATSTAARDPVFYRWHKLIDDIFERYKATLPEYTQKELDFEDVSISKVEIRSCGETTDTIRTKWVRDRVDITEGISNAMKDEILHVDQVYYDFVHLDHDDFEYSIHVTNNKKEQLNATVRIFMAPIFKDWKFEEKLATMDPKSAEEMQKVNKNSEPIFNKYRRMFIELDKFVATIPENPTKPIIRSSKNSSVTIPLKNLFMTNEEAKQTTSDSKKGNEFLAWNGCGWPDYLLIGKGNETGFPVHLFVMMTDYEKDKIGLSDPNAANEFQEHSHEPPEPHGSMSHCGAPNKKHMDAKPMGYPFDRNVKDPDLYLHHFMSKSRDQKETPVTINKYENMYVIDIKVKHDSGNPVNGSTINPE